MNRKYTQEHVDFIAANIQGCPFKELADMFNKKFGMNIKVSTLTSLADRHGLHNGRDTKYNTGWEPTQFKKGCIPWNKGKKGVCFGGKATQFKKDQMPWNYKAVGSERINSEGYIYIKIADPNKWKQKHRILWEEAHGPIPKGHALIFADGNKLNIKLDNLLLVSRKQLVRLNQNNLITNNAELTKTGIIIADIYSKIGERKRKKERGKP